MKQPKETIAMLSDIIDCLNTHQLRGLLSINTRKLEELKASMQSNTKLARGTIETLRQLRAIRQVLLARLGMEDDLERWPDR
jgi:hypothetical protein